jgi:tetratricopeptide (TPR) repeat protein
VRQLYASADYESALAALEKLPEKGSPADVIEMERYRALCLMALGRTADAELAIEHILTIDPEYQPGEQEPPRVRAAYASVRGRVLPQVARRLYVEGRAAYDRREHQAAVAAFERAIGIVDSLESGDAALNDLRTVASGFVDLSRAAMAPPPPPAPPAADATAAATPAGPTPPDKAPSAAAQRRSNPAPTPPVALQQVMPPWNPASFGSQFQSEFRGAIEVTIDEAGGVREARVIEPIHPVYDPQLLEAAKAWRYEPARLDGQPIVSVKRVDVVLRPRE